MKQSIKSKEETSEKIDSLVLEARERTSAVYARKRLQYVHESELFPLRLLLLRTPSTKHYERNGPGIDEFGTPSQNV